MLLPPINLRRRLLCPRCEMLTDERQQACVHCGYRISKRERRSLIRERKRKKKNAALVFVGIFLALVFAFSRIAP